MISVNFKSLEEEQKRLSQKVILQDSFKRIKTIAGIEYTYLGNKVVSCIVVFSSKDFEVLETQNASVPAQVPYRPDLIAYRAMPAMIEAYSKLSIQPEIIMVDGHGLIHPRRLGLASHLGLIISKPVIGVSDKLVLGNIVRIGHGKIYVNNELSGFEIKTKEHARAVYVSPGHMIAFGTALRIVKDSIRPPHKMPEPLYLAHKSLKKELDKMI